MEYLNPDDCTVRQGNILCCQCGTSILPNPANMCVGCIRTKVDITEGIPKQLVLYFCSSCERYLQPPQHWIQCNLESKELLALCLKKLKGLNRVHLVDASFVWTEPHSRRIKVKLTVQKEVMGGAILQQVFVVEYTVNNQMCDDCHRHEAKDFWNSVVQVRQKVEHKKTFYYLEQLILKHKVHSACINIKPVNDGLDFFFGKKDDARKFADFFQATVPCRTNTSQKLISHDIHSNIYNYKHTFLVEIVPICKNDVVCLPSQLANLLGSIGQLCICTRVTNSIHLIDPSTLQIAEVNSQMFWRYPFSSLCTSKQMTEYTVMNSEFIKDSERSIFAGQGRISERHVLADVWVVRSYELGLTNDLIHCRTHMGHLLKPGDTVLGFDLGNANVNNVSFDKLRKDRIPDVILVKKVYSNQSSRHRKRKWKLNHLSSDMDIDSQSDNRDYKEFLDDLEEDPLYRQNVNIYVDRRKLATQIPVEIDDEDVPQITLQEMLDDLNININNDDGQMVE